MCDEHTDAEDAAWLSRRDFARAGAGLAAAAVLPGLVTAAAAQAQGVMTVSETVRITTPDGVADGFFIRPTRGRHRAVLMWPDIAGVRPAYERMAGRLAAAGHAVLVINQYYRSAPAPHFTNLVDWRTEAGRARLQPMIAQLTPEAIARDAAACIAWLDQHPSVNRRRRVATSGYCQGGAFALRTAAAVPARVGAAASFHGGGLATAAPDSPHLLLPQMRAGLLIAIAQNDDARAPTEKDVFRAAATAAGRTAEIEVYPAQHGWCTIDAPVFDQVQADRAWTRMLAIFAAA